MNYIKTKNTEYCNADFEDIDLEGTLWEVTYWDDTELYILCRVDYAHTKLIHLGTGNRLNDMNFYGLGAGAITKALLEDGNDKVVYKGYATFTVEFMVEWNN